MTDMTKTLKILLSGAVFFAAIAVFSFKYWDYVVNPWTRDGQVRAQVIQIAPRVTAPIVNLPITDNQFVKKGDLLFELDPSTFAASLEQARAKLDETRDDIESLGMQVEEAQAMVAESEASLAAARASIKRTKAAVVKTKASLSRATELLKRGDVAKRTLDAAKADYESAVSDDQNVLAKVKAAEADKLRVEANLAEARANHGASGNKNPLLRAAKAAVKSAELNLKFTKVHAAVDGYVTNLTLRLGSQGVANQATLALVDVNSFWIHGFFRETLVGDIHPGDKAVVTLMSYSDTPLEGRVHSIGWGIAQDDGSVGENLLPSISPTFEWLRLAQRVPVRIHLDKVPDGIKLRVGTTASVLVRTGTADQKSEGSPVAAPRALQ